MYKYDFSIDDWDQPLSYVVSKVFKYNTDHIIIDNVSVATDIHVRPLPSARAGNWSGAPNGFLNRFTMVRIGAVNFR